MSSTAAPSKTFANRYDLTSNGNGRFTVGGRAAAIDDTLIDESNGTGDQLNILGDIQNDVFDYTERSSQPNGDGTFTTISDTFSLTYFGQTTGGEGVVARFPGLNPDGSDAYFLFTNQSYTSGSTITSNTNQYALCFTTGTLITTSRGDVVVEELRVGDLAVTVSGQLRPITWIGHRVVDGAAKPLPHEQQPIRVRRGAFGPGLPARDLRLSPGHPVLVGANADGQGGVLVPVMCLINGTSIVREPASTVTYWHIELDAHDILLAEGLAAESYFDMGSRAWFSGEDGLLIDPDFVPAGVHGRCRPVAIEGVLVESERVRLDAVFAAELACHSAWVEVGDWLAA